MLGESQSPLADTDSDLLAAAFLSGPASRRRCTAGLTGTSSDGSPPLYSRADRLGISSTDRDRRWPGDEEGPVTEPGRICVRTSAPSPSMSSPR
jgi:hypothetical protein